MRISDHHCLDSLLASCVHNFHLDLSKPPLQLSHANIQGRINQLGMFPSRACHTILDSRQAGRLKWQNACCTRSITAEQEKRRQGTSLGKCIPRRSLQDHTRRSLQKIYFWTNRSLQLKKDTPVLLTNCEWERAIGIIAVNFDRVQHECMLQPKPSKHEMPVLSPQYS